MVDYDKKHLAQDVIQFKFLKIRNGIENFTYQDFLNIAENGGQKANEFTGAISKALTDSHLAFDAAFYWECAPVCLKNIDSQFEFVTVKAPRLTNIKQNHSSFQEHFNNYRNKFACSFLNLGGDAMLVTPLPDSNRDYSSLAVFNDEAEDLKKKKLWKCVAEELGKALNNDKHNWKWLSTNGEGVSYVHIRIDKHPKYYQYGPYTTPLESDDLSDSTKRFFSDYKFKKDSGSKQKSLKLMEMESMDEQ